jgi:hypothetical protein
VKLIMADLKTTKRWIFIPFIKRSVGSSWYSKGLLSLCVQHNFHISATVTRFLHGGEKTKWRKTEVSCCTAKADERANRPRCQEHHRSI